MCRLKIMIIRYVSGDIIVFEIKQQIFYFLDSPNLPELYDNNLKKLIVPNLDNWLQTMTQQRYSLRGLRDMSVAFTHGLRCGISENQAKQILENTIIETKRRLLCSPLSTDYAQNFYIELLDPSKVETKYLPSIKENFGKLLRKYGEDKLYNILCRFWQFCNYHLPNTASVFENLIHRLGKEPITPAYPDTNELDVALIKEVQQSVLRSLSLYNVPDNIVRNVNKLKR